MRSSSLAAALALIVLTSCAASGGSEGPAHDEPASQQASTQPSGSFDGLSEAIANDRRADDKARDRYRHPEETLQFFDVQPTHTVAEYAPGGGWYTRILAPYVAPQGRYIAVGFRGEDTPIERVREALAGWDENMPGRVEEWTEVPADQVSAYYATAVPDDVAGTVDRILIPRMLHNLIRWEIADQELLALRKMLKDDGLVGVVQHRAKPDAPYSYTDGNKGYLHEDDVVALMELYGFTLVASSEINANPKDPANHEAGVWTLPPSYRLGDQDKDKYTEIGESDRATLLFKKAE